MSQPAIATHTLGFPRIGPRRQLKRALETYWRGESDEAALQAVAREIRLGNWRLQKQAGIDLPASNDFSLYDHVLDTACLVGALPRRFRAGDGDALLSTGTMFALARGDRRGPPLEMTKWFDTNYHHLVPELSTETQFRLASDKPFAEFREAVHAGVRTKPVLVGPLTFLLLSKPDADVAVGLAGSGDFDRLRHQLLEPLLDVYAQVLRRLDTLGAEWVQLDEPALALDLRPEWRAAFAPAYQALSRAAPRLRLMVASYFAPLADNLQAFLDLPVDGLHVDAVRGAADLPHLLERFPRGRTLSLGVVDGRNIWRTDLLTAWSQLERARAAAGAGPVMVAPSCSLLHVPYSLQPEEQLPPKLTARLAFAEEKLAEVVTLARALRGDVPGELGRPAPTPPSPPPDPLVALAAQGDREGALLRRLGYPARRSLQRERLALPPLPTTTIGSFPQTDEVRAARARLQTGELDADGYRTAMQAETARAIDLQEAIGLDVLVHGEFERTDMVEHFAQQLEGFAHTRHGWVQSYGSRCVRPPIQHGPVRRRGSMTVDWARFAQARTSRPVKGMLTGPVTILKWSFPREDQPLARSCAEIALAIREEAVDLERAGLAVIQIDEPALREGLPLRAADRPAYLGWAVACFRLASGGVSPATQIHSHMCYAEFADILPAVIALDADVLTIESARSALDALAAFGRAAYPNELGPGVWDIHAPRVPSGDQMADRLRAAIAAGLSADRLWVNPDCGLKTRDWQEVEPGLRHLVAAARALRA